MADCVEAARGLDDKVSDDGFVNMGDEEKAGVLACARHAVSLLATIPLELLAEANIRLGQNLPEQIENDFAGKKAAPALAA